MYTTEKPKSSARISPDRKGVGAFAITLITIIMVASYVFSYAMIAEAAKWVGPPEGYEWVRFLTPIFIDGAILAYTLAFSIYRWRGEMGNSVIARRGLWVFTMISVLINGAHTGSHWAWDFTKYEAWFGVLIAISAPIAALVSAEEIIRLTFQREATEELTLSCVIPDEYPVPEREVVDVPPTDQFDWDSMELGVPELIHARADAPAEVKPEPALVVSEDGLFTVPPLTRVFPDASSPVVMFSVPPITSEIPVQQRVAS